MPTPQNGTRYGYDKRYDEVMNDGNDDWRQHIYGMQAANNMGWQTALGYLIGSILGNRYRQSMEDARPGNSNPSLGGGNPSLAGGAQDFGNPSLAGGVQDVAAAIAASPSLAGGESPISWAARNAGWDAMADAALGNYDVGNALFSKGSEAAANAVSDSLGKTIESLFGGAAM